MTTLKLIAVGVATGVIIPKAMLAWMKVVKGDASMLPLLDGQPGVG